MIEKFENCCFYCVLNLKDDERDERLLKKSFKSQLLKYHPDKKLNNFTNFPLTFCDLCEEKKYQILPIDCQLLRYSYNVLTDETKRKEFDSKRKKLRVQLHVSNKIKSHNVQITDNLELCCERCECILEVGENSLQKSISCYVCGTINHFE
ncbi:hypothetical protein SNEBB_001424 [Seison nebaliae]|nr:hypothetical protein SNEBB_001424 [Seison nebaliae]